MNMPALPGADELIVPLNVVEGGLASPNDTDPTKALPLSNHMELPPTIGADFAEQLAKALVSAMKQAQPQAKALPEGEGRQSGPFGSGREVRIRVKARPEVERPIAEVLSRFCNRQRETYIGELAKLDLEGIDLVAAIKRIYEEKSGTWLGDVISDLYDCAKQPIASAATRSMAMLGVDPEELDESAVVKLASNVCRKHAHSIAQSALDSLVDAASAVDAPNARSVRALVHDTFRKRVEPYVENHSNAMATYVASAGSCEGARQSGVKCQKEWVCTGHNSRDSHAKMSGERVGIDKKFHNGARWPGDTSLPPEETCNCMCRIEIISGKGRASGHHTAEVRKEADEGTKAVNLAWQEFKRNKTKEHYQRTVGEVIRSWSSDGRITASYYAKPVGKELQAARALAENGYVVEFLNTLGGGKHPDIEVNGLKADFKRLTSFNDDKVFERIKDCAKKADIAVIDLSLDTVMVDKAVSKAKDAIAKRVIAKGRVLIIDWRGDVAVV